MNRNTLYAEIFVDELARAGLKAVCAAPGSRHTPLMLAFARHSAIKVYSHLDERSASFFALGLALASDEPVALICTSGTAGANMYPAIIEAHQSHVPLIVITADRPPELRASGANQTIDQIKMFGDFVLWFVDAALPEAHPSVIAIRNLRTLAGRAYAKANGLRKGVVHINMPFRKPLEPVPVEGDAVVIPQGAEARDNGNPFSTIHYGQRMPDSATIQLANIIHDHPNGLVIAGINALQSYPFTASQIERFAELSGYPFLADAVSGVRFGGKAVIGGYDSFMQYADLPEVDLIIRFGSIPLSNWLNQYVARCNPKHYIHFSVSGDWSDDDHAVTQVMIPSFDTTFMEERPHDSALSARYAAVEASTWQAIDQQMQNGAYFDGGVLYDIVDLIPPESTLFAGNSLPVRLLDQFGKPQSKRIYTYANRGTSGIDGNISSALGAGAANPDKPLVAVVGDITFYHDMNGLLAVQRCGIPITLVLLNNDGGGIFHRLPIKDHEPEFTEYFLTPHGLDFSHAAKLYGLAYVQIDASAVDAREHFRTAFSASVSERQSTIIEVRTDARRDLARRGEILKALQEQLQKLER